MPETGANNFSTSNALYWKSHFSFSNFDGTHFGEFLVYRVESRTVEFVILIVYKNWNSQKI